MRGLLFGGSGQLGRALLAHGDIDWIAPTRAQADLLDPATLDRWLQEEHIDLVVNAAAWTDVEGAERHQRSAERVNAEAAGRIARSCAERGRPLVHLSTAFVFAGRLGRPLRPDDPPAPLNHYGRTKLAGELAVRAASPRHVILRTNAVFRPGGTGFVQAVLSRAEAGLPLRVVDDQWVGPTPARCLSDAVLTVGRALLTDDLRETHHFTGKPDVRYADFARALLDANGHRPVPVHPIPSTAWPSPVRRPLDVRLCGAALAERFGIQRPDWRQHLGALP